jgi:hypothetical protein
VAMQHRAIVVVDVASFTDPARTLLDQRTVHEGLYWILRTAFDESGIDLKGCKVEDRGDGAMVLVPPEFPKSWLVDRLPARLLACLREYNAVHTTESQIMLRVAVHAGEVYQNTNGVVSQAVNLAFRIVDAAPAKSALAASGGMLALIASNDFYHNVVQHEPAADPASYRRIAVSVKQLEAVAWLRLPELPAPMPTQVQTTTPVVSQAPVAQPVRPNSVIFAIVEALLELPFVREVNGRQMLIDMLRPEIATAVPYQSSARLHAYALVSTCIRHEHGLAELFEAVRRLDGESVVVRRLEAIERTALPPSVD